MSLYNINKQTQIDEFGVDHSNFSLREELEYNKMRADERNAAERQSFRQPQQYWQQTPIAYQGGQTALPAGMQQAITPKKPMYEPFPKTDWNNVVSGAITGAGEGIIGGIERFANSLSDGRYGKILDSNFDNAYTNRQDNLQGYADSVNLGNANRLANTAIDISGGLLPYVYGLRMIRK